MLNVYQPPVAPGWAEVVQGPPRVAVAVALFRHHYLFYGKRTSTLLYGTPGGDAQAGEHPRKAAKRLVQTETGVDLGELYLIFSGTREFGVRGGSLPVHLFLAVLDLDAEPGTCLPEAALAGKRDDHGIECPDLPGFPQRQPGGRHDSWHFLHSEEANAQPQRFSPVLRWALEIYCKKAPDIALPWDHEAVPLTQASHVQGLIDRE
jgi:ADP-ribose pyrophosphatase YjhB (NUDIX family)